MKKLTARTWVCPSSSRSKDTRGLKRVAMENRRSPLPLMLSADGRYSSRHGAAAFQNALKQARAGEAFFVTSDTLITRTSLNGRCFPGCSGSFALIRAWLTHLDCGLSSQPLARQSGSRSTGAGKRSSRSRTNLPQVRAFCGHLQVLGPVKIFLIKDGSSRSKRSLPAADPVFPGDQGARGAPPHAGGPSSVRASSDLADPWRCVQA